MKKIILILLIAVLFMPSEVWAACATACTKDGTTYTCTDISYDCVSAAVSAASAGDTINVAAGSATWGSTLAITKGINLIGAGIGNTIITISAACNLGYTGNHCWSYRPANYDLNTPFRISGFTIDLNNSGGWLFLGDTGKAAPFTVQDKVRIDHNRIINPKAVPAGWIWNTCSVYGVVDNNVFEGAFYGFKNDAQVVDSYNWYNTEPQSIFVVGSANYLYYEDNTMALTTSDNALSEAQYAGRYAFRYNTITGGSSSSLFETHPHYTPGNMPAVFGAEIYGNRATNAGSTFYKNQTAGQSIVFWNSIVGTNNIATYVSNCDCAPEEYHPEDQVMHDTFWWGNRSQYTGAVTNYSITGNLTCNGLTGVPTAGRDVLTDASNPGVGCGTLAQRPGTCEFNETTGVGPSYWATDQSCTDLTGMVGKDPSTPISGTLYKCTADNTWTEYYTPYAYPHPLRGVTSATYSISGGTISGGSIK